MSSPLVIVAKGTLSYVKELAERCEAAGIDVALNRCVGKS